MTPAEKQAARDRIAALKARWMRVAAKLLAEAIGNPRKGWKR